MTKNEKHDFQCLNLKIFIIFQSRLIYGRGQIDECEILVFDDRSFRL